MDPSSSPIFLLRLVPSSGAKRLNVPSTAGGIAYIDPGRHGVVAFVFPDRVEQISTHQNLPQELIMGHLIAHELGHLLLGDRSHSLVGLMFCPWGQREFDSMPLGMLNFTSAEAERVREQVRSLGQGEPAVVAEGRF